MFLCCVSYGPASPGPGPGSPEKMGRVLQRAGFTWAGFSRGPSSPDTDRVFESVLKRPGTLINFWHFGQGVRCLFGGGYGNFILGIGHPVTLARTAWLRTGRLSPGRQPQDRLSNPLIVNSLQGDNYQHSQMIMFKLISKQCTCNLEMAKPH